jgi:hypothetical protein
MYACIGVVVSALAAISYPIFLPMTTQQYHIAVALLCFALSTVTGLFLSVRVDFRGTLGPYVLILGGPGALWIVTMFVFSHIFPDENAGPPIPVLPAPGELSYNEWLSQLDEVRDVFLESEDEEIPKLIGNIYYPGNNHNKPVQTTVQFLLGYFPDGEAIGLKHIRGTKKGAQLELFHRPRPSTLGSIIQDRSFVQKSGVFEDLAGKDNETWYKFSSSTVDFYEITLYTETSKVGDFLIIDVPKYISGNDDGAKIYFSLVTAKSVSPKDFTAWRVKPFPVSGQVPLLFKKRGEQASSGVEQRTNFMPFLQWVEQLRQAHSSDTDKPTFFANLDRMLAQMPQAERSLLQVLSSEKFTSRLGYELVGAQETIVFTYHWQ